MAKVLLDSSKVVGAPEQLDGARKLSALAGLVKRYSNPEFSVAHGGHVQTIAAGNYTVTGLSRHVMLGEFVAHRSSTGIHLGEVVRVEPDSVVVCPIEPGEPIGIHDTVIRKGAFRVAPAAAWCGRTVNALGEPIDGRGPLPQGDVRRSISNTAPPSMTRSRFWSVFHDSGRRAKRAPIRPGVQANSSRSTTGPNPEKLSSAFRAPSPPRTHK